jgi:hypothetical protein
MREDVWSKWLRRIFGPKKEKVTAGWRKLYNLYSSQNIMWMVK